MDKYCVKCGKECSLFHTIANNGDIYCSGCVNDIIRLFSNVFGIEAIPRKHHVEVPLETFLKFNRALLYNKESGKTELYLEKLEA